MAILTGRVALVTGGGRGIGRAIALALATYGAKVSVTARSVDAIHAVSAELGENGMAVAGDVTQPEDVQRIIQTTTETFGPIDILVNNAGTLGPMGHLEDTDPAAWTQAVAVNLFGVYYFMQALLPGMKARGYGRIINIGTGAAKGNGMKNISAYSTSKAAMTMLTRHTAVDLADTGVTVNSVAPGVVDTAMTQTIRANPDAGASGERLRRLYDDGQMFQPEDVAHWMVAVILSDKNGEILDVRQDSDELDAILHNQTDSN
jgi:NAD(P)-dependent dehydrogenase (short-subunit alcohol dehydrogenase family)